MTTQDPNIVQKVQQPPGAVPTPGVRPGRGDRIALARQTSSLLRALGDDPVTVAGSLAGAGVRGLPADARQCALAVYLRAVMQGDARVCAVRVFHDRVVVATPGRYRQRRVLVPLPAPLRAFVSGFDAQRYPALVRERPARGRRAVPEKLAAGAAAGQPGPSSGS